MRKYFSLIFLFSIGFVATSVAQVLPSYVPANGLEGYWSFSGNAQDVSLNANHGTVSNAILTTDRFGKTNSAYAFNGTSARIITSKIPNLSSDYTISAWLNTTSFANYGTIIDCRTSASAGIGLETNSKISFTISKGVYNQFYTNFLLQANEWVHVVAVHTGTQNLIYINGVLDNTQPYTQNLLPTTEPFVIGDRGVTPSGPGNYFSGKLDDIGVWSRALSPAEITNIFKAPVTANITQSNTTICAGSPITLSVDTSGFSANSSTTLPANLQTGLIAYYPFNGNANDESGNGNNGTVNGATLTTNRFGISNSAYYFSSSNCATWVQANVNTTSITTDLSIVLWALKVGEGCSQPRLLEFLGNSIDGPGSSQWVWSSLGQRMGSITSNGTEANSTFNARAINTWTQLVYTNNGTIAKFYQDGILLGSSTTSGNPILGGNVSFGRMNHASWDAFNGKLDDIAIYNRALSASEVQQLYNPQPQILWSTGATTPSITVNPSTTTTYYVTLTDGGVSSTDSVTVTVETPLATITPSGSTTIFQGQSVSLTANAGASYLWSTGATTRTINVNTAGTYTVTVTTANGCSATSQPTSVTLALKADISQGDTTICAGTPITLSVDTTGFTRNVGSATLAPNLQVGMVVHYPFNGNVNDQSGNGHNGTILGATLAADRFGNANSAYLMDGISYSTPKGISSPYVVDNSKPYSYSIWFKSNDANKANQSIINSGIHTGFVLSFNHPYSPNKIMACIGNPNTGWTVCNDTNAWTISDPLNWHHAAVVKNSTSVKYYMDGQLQKTLAIGPNENMGSFNFIMGAISINGGPAWGYETFSGIIDDAIFYDKALSASEVQQLYNPQPQILWSTGATTPSITVNPTATTTYTVTITDGGVSSTDSVTVTVETPLATITPSGSTAIFQGQSVNLSANAGASYVWSTGATTRTINVNTAGTYTVTVTTANGCSATSQPTSIRLVAKADISQGDTTICANSPLTLSVSAGLAAFQARNQDLTLFKSINNHHYFYKPTAMTWAQAKTQSDAIGAYLYIINDATEEQEVYNALPFKGNDGKHYWLGLYQDTSSPSYSEPSGGWKWVNGDALTYSNWQGSGGQGSEPNNMDGGENFAQMEWSSYGMRWNDGGPPTSNGTQTSYPIFELEASNISILWSTGATTPSITVNPSTTTTYTVTITDGGVSSTDSVKVTVDTPIATITPSGPTALCTGGTVTLSANAGASYVWSTGATTQSITVSAAGSYTVTVTNARGCSATSVATAVTVNPLPTASITASGPTTFCAGGSVTLTANAASSYLWSNGATTQSITVSAAGAYTVRVTNATGCTSAASAATSVVVNALPTASITASGPTSFCAGGSVTLTANAASSYLWSNGATTQSITVSAAGAYTVRVTNTTGCTSVASAATTVVLNASPTASITASGPTSFCAGGSVTLSANAGSSYLWSNGATTQSITVSTAGSYTVRVTNATGCISTSSSAVSVSVTGALNIPNTFTPNGDGVNDTWVIDQINQYPTCTVTVFNKMGNKVFESVGYTQPWQGKFKDNDLPFDVYYYVIDVKCGSLLKGWIALIK